jgi:creatinine amidohydrolase
MKSWIPDSRNFAYLTWKQVDALPRDKTLLVLPTAAIEQHGPHLPLATDTLINSILLGAALARLPQETSVYALPAVCYGKSNEHIGFPGTLSVSSTTWGPASPPPVSKNWPSSILTAATRPWLM